MPCYAIQCITASGDNIISTSSAMQKVMVMIKRIARSNSTVMIEGESGTGKEVIAQWLHAASERAGHPLVTVNCATIPGTLVESELFGSVKGAYTGATLNRDGYFAAAEGGTIFLDEIGDISPKLQSGLLRVLQEREIRRIGHDRVIPIDIRIISATNKDLEEMVAEGSFREDLYHRLNVIRINTPPLRQRREDIPLLADHFLERFNRMQGRMIGLLSDEALPVPESAPSSVIGLDSSVIGEMPPSSGCELKFPSQVMTVPALIRTQA